MEKQLSISPDRETIVPSKRNGYIDFLRGIAAIAIIMIHTACWGGLSYVPQWFWNVTLFFDVPLFFYLSGWASSYRESNIIKSGKSVLGIWLKWFFFATVMVLIAAFSPVTPMPYEGVIGLRDYVNILMFNTTFPGFEVISGSVWFLQVYFVVIMLNTFALVLMQRSDKAFELKKFYMWFLLACFVWASFGGYLLGLSVVSFAFYGFIWMLGYNRMCKAKNWLILILGIIASLAAVVLMSNIQDLPLFDIQNAKFPPSPKYLFVSLPLILIAKFFDGKYKPGRGLKTFLEHIGKNAIFYFFAQGVGSSINYCWVEKLNVDPWYLKWIITFAINLVTSIIIAEILLFIYRKISVFMNWLIKHLKVLFV